MTDLTIEVLTGQPQFIQYSPQSHILETNGPNNVYITTMTTMNPQSVIDKVITAREKGKPVKFIYRDWIGEEKELMVASAVPGEGKIVYLQVYAI